MASSDRLQVQGAYVVDATAEEAACMTSCVHVGVTPQGLIQGFSLGTTAGLPPSSLKVPPFYANCKDGEPIPVVGPLVLSTLVLVLQDILHYKMI